MRFLVRLVRRQDLLHHPVRLGLQFPELTAPPVRQLTLRRGHLYRCMRIAGHPVTGDYLSSVIPKRHWQFVVQSD